jgi:hypothetical protein
MSDLDTAARALTDSGLDSVAGPTMAAAIDKGALAVQRHVRAAASRHRRSGRLEQFVRVISDGSGLKRVAKVHASGRVAHLITGGTAPHEIAAVTGVAIPIAAGVGQAEGFAAHVEHPGTRPDPFVARGVDQASGDVKHITDDAIDRIAHDLARRMEGSR